MEQNNTCKFEWSDMEDDELYKNGITIAWFAGRTTAIQRFVEALSYRIGSKCDFSFFGGRAHLDVMPDFSDKALEVLADETFMKKFLVPYSIENYDNGTYMELLSGLPTEHA